MADEKLQKVLARTGYGSRREMERWIDAGRISVNGELATLGDRIKRSDGIKLDGEEVELLFERDAERRVLLYNKPLGEICTRSDPEGRPTVFERLPPLKTGRWIAVGRLDINTSGLLLFTNDGALANQLMHPSSEIDREYAVRVLGDVSDETIDLLKDGVLLDDGMAKFTDIQFFNGDGANKWYHCVVMEGRNREVRRLWESQGLTVSRLKRVRFGPVFLPSDVKVGTWKDVAPKEVKLLSGMLGLAQQKTMSMTPEEAKSHSRRYKRQKTRQDVSATKPKSVE